MPSPFDGSLLIQIFLTFFTDGGVTYVLGENLNFRRQKMY
jgi:hypothetical protein